MNIVRRHCESNQGFDLTCVEEQQLDVRVHKRMIDDEVVVGEWIGLKGYYHLASEIIRMIILDLGLPRRFSFSSQPH